MRVVIQNGANHSMTRYVVQRAIQMMPKRSERFVSSITVLAEQTDAPIVMFHSKERSFAVSGPKNHADLPVFLEEVLISLSVIFELGKLPDSVKSSILAEHKQKVSQYHVDDEAT